MIGIHTSFFYSKLNIEVSMSFMTKSISKLFFLFFYYNFRPFQVKINPSSIPFIRWLNLTLPSLMFKLNSNHAYVSGTAFCFWKNNSFSINSRSLRSSSNSTEYYYCFQNFHLLYSFKLLVRSFISNAVLVHYCKSSIVFFLTMEWK